MEIKKFDDFNKVNEGYNPKTMPDIVELTQKLKKSKYSLNDLIDVVSSLGEEDDENNVLGQYPNWGEKYFDTPGLQEDLMDGTNDPLVWIVDLIQSVFKDECYGC